MGQVAQLLTKAKELITKPENWCQGSYYNTPNGYKAYTKDKAYSYCSLGALLMVEGSTDAGRTKASSLLKNAMGGQRVADFNDTHTHAEVLDAFSKAILEAEIEGV